MKGKPIKRILAIDVRPRRFGYVVFESPVRLVDLGSGKYDADAAEMARIAWLFRLLQPSTVVLREISVGSQRDRAATRKHTKAIQAEADRFSITTKFISDKTIRTVFQGNERHNKHDVASLVAAHFPELKWKLPTKRKPWETEHWRMSVFDAAALGLTYISRSDPEATRHLFVS